MIHDVESLGLTILSQCLFAFHRAFGNSSVTNKTCGACIEKWRQAYHQGQHNCNFPLLPLVESVF